MKKITITIATILISSMSYAQSEYVDYVLIEKWYQQEIITQIDSMLVYLKQDIKSEDISRKSGKYYIKQLKAINRAIKKTQTLKIEQ